VLGTYVKGQPPPSGDKGPNNITAIQQFGNAFAPKGTFRVWGCNIQDKVKATLSGTTTEQTFLILNTARMVIEEAFSRPLKKGGLHGATLRTLPAGATTITIDMGAEFQFERQLQSDPHAGDGFDKLTTDQLLEVHYGAFPNFFIDALVCATAPKKTLLTPTLSDIAKFVTGVMMDSYGFKAAAALPAAVVYTGAPGTSADLDDTTQMHIDGPRIQEAKFFNLIAKTIFDDDFSSMNRHYTRLDSTAVTSITDISSQGLP
jgi:hypothetical protein